MDPRIAHIIERMDNTIAEPLDVPALARLAGLSPSRFAHLFRAQVGMPPARYLHQLRMRRARALLERSFLSVRDVMRQVGFRDPSHFARDFRRYHGMAPSMVRGASHHPSPLQSPRDPALTTDTAHADDAGRLSEDVQDPVKRRCGE
jgi:AraC family transcriptional regulator of arabinose operon